MRYNYTSFLMIMGNRRSYIQVRNDSLHTLRTKDRIFRHRHKYENGQMSCYIPCQMWWGKKLSAPAILNVIHI